MSGVELRIVDDQGDPLPWDDEAVVSELRSHVGADIGADDAVLVLDPSAFPKKGTESCGVDRQWCGRLGKVDHCHGAIDLGSVSSKGPTLVDTRLSLPKAWTQEKARLDKAGVPKAWRGYRTRHQ